MKHIKLFEEFISEQDVICEATVMMDALDPNSRDLKKLLKKHNVEMEIGAGTEVTLTGKRSDLEKVLADPMGWDDPDLAEYIEESKSLNESFLVTAAAAAAGVAGLMVLVKTAPFFRRVAGEASQMLGSAVLRKLEKDRLDKYTAIIDGIVAKFEGDEVLKTMYTELPAYSDRARDKASNVARTKQLKVIGEYIKTKLSEDELKYFVDISKSLRGLAEISESY
jgi:hypothetical protein